MVPEIAKKLTSCGIPVFPCFTNKEPAIKGGFKSASTNLEDYWPSCWVGVPIQEGVVVIDVDSYKGMTLSLIEEVLGCSLDWESAIIQNTPSGGSHYAFYSEQSSQLKQGSDLFSDIIGVGFDTRVALKGYICSGESYQEGDSIGILKLAMPSLLPPLPAQAASALSYTQPHTQEPKPFSAITPGSDSKEIVEMLNHISSDCSRSEWLKVALALKNHYGDSDEGWIIFDKWSSTGGECYDYNEADKLWRSISRNADSGRDSITLSTIAYTAMKNGYAPSSIASEAFRELNRAEPPIMEGLIDKIVSDGGNPKNLDAITTEIRHFSCTELQRSALKSILDRALKENGVKITSKILSKAVGLVSDSPSPPAPLKIDAIQPFNSIPVKSINGLSSDHSSNAELVYRVILGDRLASFDGTLYWWSGLCWEKPSTEAVLVLLTAAFSQSGHGTVGTIEGTKKQLPRVVPALPQLHSPNRQIFFKNGVFDPQVEYAGLSAHQKENYNTTILSSEYNPRASHPEWDKFLQSIFHSEPSRIELLQEIMGWFLMTDSLGFHKAIAFDGASRGGKGTIIKVLKSILQSHMTIFSFLSLGEKQTLSTIKNSSVIVDSDAKRPSKSDAPKVHANFNRITAGESIDININYQQETWNGVLGCKMLIACNGLPILADDSSAAPNRWIILKFTENFTDREDLTLSDRLLKETSAIASWAAEGASRLVKNMKFTIPDSSKLAMSDLKQASSPLSVFLKETIEFKPSGFVGTKDLWSAYRKWCILTNTKNYLTSYNFSRLVKQSMIENGAEYKNKLSGGSNRGYIGAQIIYDHTSGSDVIPFVNTGT